MEGCVLASVYNILTIYACQHQLLVYPTHFSYKRYLVLPLEIGCHYKFYIPRSKMNRPL
jgi:hypothetical protein